MTDFRGERMESPEGRGIARRAWEAYSGAARDSAIPGLSPIIDRVAAKVAADLFGFWLLWHLQGGFEGLRRGGMSRATIYRRINLFRKLTGEHPDEFQLPGVTIDVAAYRSAADPQSQD